MNLGCTRGRNPGLFDHYRNRLILHGLDNFAVATKAHDIFVGGSQGRVYVADRKNNRLQVFDQDGDFIVAWKEFGQPSSVFVGKDDAIYVGTSFPDPSAKKGELRGIVVGSAKDGSLKAFIPDPADLDTLDAGTSASGIAANGGGNIYVADVAAHNLRKYVKAP